MGYIIVSNQNLIPVIQRNMGKRWCSGSLISLLETSESFWVNYGCYGFLWHKIKCHSNRWDKWRIKTVTNGHLFTSALIPGSSSSCESLSVKDIFSYSHVLTLEKSGYGCEMEKHHYVCYVTTWTLDIYQINWSFQNPLSIQKESFESVMCLTALK